MTTVMSVLPRAPVNVHTFGMRTQYSTNNIIMFFRRIAQHSNSCWSSKDNTWMLMKFMLLPTPAPSRVPVNIHSVYLLASALSSWQALANWTLVQWARSDQCAPAIGVHWLAVRDEKTTVLGRIESQWLDSSFYWVGSVILSMIIGCSLRCTDDANNEL